jgi:N-acetylmuramoyl-L-alanine amidase
VSLRTKPDEKPTTAASFQETRTGKGKPAFSPPRKITSRVRKQLLRGAVDENLDLLNNQPLGTNRRDRERKRRRLKRWIFGASTIIATVGSAAFVQNLDLGAGPDETVPAGLQTAATVPEGPPSEGNAPDTAWPPSAAVQLVPQTIPLSVRTIAIDPGHGGRDGGTSLQFGMLEKDLTLDLGMRLAEILRGAGLRAILTREQDHEISLADRADAANTARADLFVSIHVNWLPDRSARGFETYYLGHSDDPFLNRLAAAENRDSGFTVADTRSLLEAIYTNVRRTESRRLAEAVQGSLFDVLRTKNDDVVSRGVMSAPFVVLVATEMPAILAEVACLSNEGEARLLAIPGYRQQIAQGLADGILRYADDVGGRTNRTQGDTG